MAAIALDVSMPLDGEDCAEVMGDWRTGDHPTPVVPRQHPARALVPCCENAERVITRLRSRTPHPLMRAERRPITASSPTGPTPRASHHPWHS